MGCSSSGPENHRSSSLFSIPSLSSIRYIRSPSSSSSLIIDPTQGSFDNIPFYPDFEEFTNLQYLSSGCIGSVYSANHKVLGKVALKFFGYTKQFPDVLSIQHELAFLSLLREIEGVVQLKGYFIDTHDGYLPHKQTLGEFPVLVMEFLEGGELPKAIQQQQRTERHLAQIFRCLILALQGIHQKRFLHRDLKLENLMFVSNSKEPVVKIIDFGSMVSLPVSSINSKTKTKEPSESLEIYRSFGLVGSPGMIAPETIMNYEYSSATDIWQAGCVLYSLLSGHHAFSPNRVDKIVNAAYFPLTSTQWDPISEDAKNMISLILVKNPNDRLTIPQILSHRWMVNAEQASQKDLGEDYSTRIKSLALSRRIRAVFVKQDNLLLTRREKLENIQLLNPSFDLKEFKHGVTPCESSQSKARSQQIEPEYSYDRESCASNESPRSHLSIQQNIEERVFLLKKNIINFLQSNLNLNSPRGKSNSVELDGIAITPVIYEEDSCLTENTTQQIIPNADHVLLSSSSSALPPPDAPDTAADAAVPAVSAVANSSKTRNGSLSSEDGSALVSSLSELTQPSQQSLMSEMLDYSNSNHPPNYSLLNSSNERSKSFLLSSSTALKYPIKARYIDYQTFQQLLLDSGLETFATKEIFEIFDSSSHRLKVIDVMDVLFTFLVMYEDLAEYYSSPLTQSQSLSQGMTRGGEGLSPSSLSSSPPHATTHISDGNGKQMETDLFDNSQLYFDMFDLNHTGTIDAKNLKIILRCLLLEEKYLSHYSNTLLRHSQTPPLPPHQTLTAKRSFKSKPSHLRRRSSSSDISPVHFLGQQHSGRFQQQQQPQQSFDTIRSMKSSDCDDLFQILDEDKNGYITYAEFKDFYDTLYLQLDSLPPSFA